MQSSMKSVTSSFIIIEANKITYLTIKFDLTSLVGCFCIRIQNQMRNFDSKQCQQNSFYSSSNITFILILILLASYKENGSFNI